jgi:threonine dehydrogenase-like Zn-dependent dehydrogenase
MRAIIANGPKDYTTVTDKPIPTIQDGEVLVKVLATGICKYSCHENHSSISHVDCL